jgi:hypothetical protein
MKIFEGMARYLHAVLSIGTRIQDSIFLLPGKEQLLQTE